MSLFLIDWQLLGVVFLCADWPEPSLLTDVIRKENLNTDPYSTCIFKKKSQNIDPACQMNLDLGVVLD